MRVLVTGSRTWRSPAVIAEAILEAAADFQVDLADMVIVHGDCRTGADAMARLFVESHPMLHQEPYPADWKRFGNRAGYIRNVHMVSTGADLCLAFLHNNSAGTLMTLRLARGAGIPRRVFVDEDGQDRPLAPTLRLWPTS